MHFLSYAQLVPHVLLTCPHIREALADYSNETNDSCPQLICTHLALEFSIEHISSPPDILTHLFVFSQLDCQLHESRISVYVVHCLVSLKPRTVAGTEYVL